jgi:hypothetical protein
MATITKSSYHPESANTHFVANHTVRMPLETAHGEECTPNLEHPTLTDPAK